MDQRPLRGELSRQDKILSLAGALLGLFLGALDQTIVATAGPAIQSDLEIAPGLYTWITTSYLVASTVMVPVYGKLSDQLGRRRILLTGIGIFLIGSLLCGLAGSAITLILFRAVQGTGAAALFTTAFAVIADLFVPAERAKYQGLFTGVFGVSSLIGPLIGGFITDQLGWHWVFFVNLPIGLVAIGLIVAKMPPLLPESESRGRIDVPGAVLLVLGVTPLMLALSLGHSNPKPGEVGFAWASVEILTLLVAAVVMLVAFVIRELRAPEPIVDLHLYRNQTFALSSACGFLVGASFLAGPVFLPLYLVNVAGASATRAGLTMMPLTMGVVMGASLGGQLGSRLKRYKPIVVASCGLLLAGFLIMGFTMDAGIGELGLAWRMLLLGLGVGPTLPLLTIAIQNAVPAWQVGVATAAITFARVLGQVLGVALLGSIFAATM
jgi:EmrB/QacA subfamily drug resistance transporter